MSKTCSQPTHTIFFPRIFIHSFFGVILSKKNKCEKRLGAPYIESQ